MNEVRIEPRVTAVVLTRNRREELLASLARLRAAAPGAVIVVDNGSADGTADAVRRLSGVELVALAGNAGAAGRNAGVERARTRYVALCDDDTWWAPTMLTRAADLLDACPDVAVVTARILVGPEGREDPASAMMASSPLPRRPDVPAVPVLGFMAGACMVRRSAFLDAGGFEPRFVIGGEEALLAADLAARGWWLVYAPHLTVHHVPSTRREGAARACLLLRNGLWFAWLRRPWSAAAARTAPVVRRAFWDRTTRRALYEAVCGLSWVLRRRRVLPRNVEALLRLLEAPPASAEDGPRFATSRSRVAYEPGTPDAAGSGGR